MPAAAGTDPAEPFSVEPPPHDPDIEADLIGADNPDRDDVSIPGGKIRHGPRVPVGAPT